ncbi:MAG: glycosyltransferase [Bryobacteraceae bacterium]
MTLRPVRAVRSPSETRWRRGRSGSVLVGIVTRNRAAILPIAIRSALSQSYEDLCITVLNDGSSDGTSALRSQFPEVEWLNWESPRGLIAARNQLMQTTEAEYYLSLDDDAWFLTGDEISVAIQHLQRNRTLAAVALDILTPERGSSAARSAARPVAAFIGCGHVLRMSAVREAGFYVSSPGLYGSEEKDLCLRLLDRNWDIHLLPGVHVWHDKTSVARNQPAQHCSGVCNDLVVALRRCPFPLALGVLPIKILNHLRFSVTHGLTKPCIDGLGLFFSKAPALLSSRGPVRSATFTKYVRRTHQIL